MSDRPAWTPVVTGLDSRHLPGPADLPEDPGDCCIEVTASIGDGTGGADNFEVTFVTPRWLARQEQAVVPEYTVVIPQFTWTAVEEVLQRLIAAVAAVDWDEFTQEFGRYAYWELSQRPRRF